jgi:hypothetical protein
MDDLHSLRADVSEMICFKPVKNASTKMTGKHIGKRHLEERERDGTIIFYHGLR